jgi:ankyrin repeat protein
MLPALSLLKGTDADIDVHDYMGHTALHIAVLYRKEEAARYDALMHVICKHWY